MIIEFSVENFRSFKDPAKLSMVAARAFKEHQATHTIQIEEGIRLLKTAVLFGGNASGKSNLLLAILFMRHLVMASFKDSLATEGRGFQIPKFKLDRQSLSAPTTFEITFFKDGTWFRYGFEINDSVVSREWLFQNTTKEVPLFKRTGQSFEINKSTFQEGLGLEKFTRENVLFLTLVAQLNGAISRRVVDCFDEIRSASGITPLSHDAFTIELMKTDPKFRIWISRFLQFLEIASITTEKQMDYEFSVEELRSAGVDEESIIHLRRVQDNLKKNRSQDESILVWHRQYDGNGLLTDTISFDLESEESEGTKKLIYLLGPWYMALKNGLILVIDELDSSLHSALIPKLLEFFHKENQTNAQLIFTVQDTTLLDKEIFRRDQIFFLEKNQFGASSLYSLGDFKSSRVRNSSDFAKNYLGGKYGAVPHFQLDQKLKSLINEQA